MDQLRRLLKGGGRYAAQTCLEPIELALAVLDSGDWPLAAGLGNAIVGEAVSGAKIGADFGAINAVNDSDRHLHCNWGWPMLDVDRWPEPIAARGAQGLWNWPTPDRVGL